MITASASGDGAQTGCAKKAGAQTACAQMRCFGRPWSLISVFCVDVPPPFHMLSSLAFPPVPSCGRHKWMSPYTVIYCS